MAISTANGVAPPPNPIPPEAGDAVMQACTQLADVIAQGGNDPTAFMVACSTLVNGGGGAQLQALLESPSLGCFAASPVTVVRPRGVGVVGDPACAALGVGRSTGRAPNMASAMRLAPRRISSSKDAPSKAVCD